MEHISYDIIYSACKVLSLIRITLKFHQRLVVPPSITCPCPLENMISSNFYRPLLTPLPFTLKKNI